MLLNDRKLYKNKSGIYKITNKFSNFSYIGQAANISLRVYQHIRASFSESAKDYNYPLHKAIRKYGLDSFTLEILEECPERLLNSREIYWIAFYDTHKNGYNQTAGGYQSIRQIKLTEIEVDQIRNRLLNTTDSYDKIATDFNICNNMVIRINKGICWNNPNLKYPLRNGQAVKIKKQLNTGTGVYQLDKTTGEVLNIFISASQAALYLGGYEYCINIGRCLSGKRKSAYGYRWETRPITEQQFNNLLQTSKVDSTVKQLF